jgi:hypothetical protein
MAYPNYPSYTFKRPFASQGDKQLIPDQPTVPARANLLTGFPPETQVPLDEGGTSPHRYDFNGLFYALSSFAYWQQSGGHFSYNSQLDYTTPCIVFHNNKLYYCLANNGPNNGNLIITPGTNDNVWENLLLTLGKMMGSHPSAGNNIINLVNSNTCVYSSDLVYTTPSIVYHDGKLYWCLIENGPGTVRGVVTPGNNDAIWQNLLLAIANMMGSGSTSNNIRDIFGGVPVGTIIHYWGTTAPTGYLVCDGRTYDIDVYTELYALLGKNTTPDLRGMFLRGQGGNAATFKSVQQDAGRQITMTADDAIGTFPTTEHMNGQPKGTGCFEITNITAHRHQAVAGPHAQYYGVVTMRLNNIQLWPSGNMGPEFRPINMSVLMCIKCT